MNDVLRPVGTRLWYPIALAVLAAIWLATLLFGAGSLDGRVYELLYAGGSPVLVSAAKFVTKVGDPTVMVIGGLAVAAYLALRQRLRLALALSLVLLSGRALAEVQKFAVGRVRPGLEPHLVSAKTFSFVSGHAANSMIALLAVALALAPEGRWRPVMVACAVFVSVLIGFSRVMLGVHWPSDVIGGWAYGVLWVLLTLRPAERMLAVPFRR
jgi:undecaprenyl-diphosphatase